MSLTLVGDRPCIGVTAGWAPSDLAAPFAVAVRLPPRVGVASGDRMFPVTGDRGLSDLAPAFLSRLCDRVPES